MSYPKFKLKFKKNYSKMHSCTAAPQGHIFWSFIYVFPLVLKTVNWLFGFWKNPNKSWWEGPGLIWPGSN